MDINNNFTYHTPTPESIPKFDIIREKARELAHLLDDVCPESREKSIALTKLEESVFWANASIARNL